MGDIAERTLHIARFLFQNDGSRKKLSNYPEELRGLADISDIAVEPVARYQPVVKAH
jgi:hypothetical protein